VLYWKKWHHFSLQLARKLLGWNCRRKRWACTRLMQLLYPPPGKIIRHSSWEDWTPSPPAKLKNINSGL
jgi:hypothetical protein